MTTPKILAGLHCYDVLALLESYVEGSLDDRTTQQVRAHLSECQACTAFGGRYAALVGALHEHLAQEDEQVSQQEARDKARELFRRHVSPRGSG